MKYSYLARAVCIGLVSGCIAPNVALADELNNMETITVTGQKIDRSLQETPTSVAVVTNKQIEEQNLVDAYDILAEVPNVHGRFGRGFSIRGIDAFNVSGGGNSYLTSVYVDGAVLPLRMIQQGAFSAWDVSQVEILRGPQSTLQGRNALAGAIVMRTERPTYEWQGKMRVSAGEYGRQEVAVALGGELVEDQLAFRFSGEDNQFDGVNDNITRNDHSDYRENSTYRLKMLYEPKAIEGLTALLSYTLNESDDGVPWVNFEEGASYDRRITTFNDLINEFTENDILNLEVDYEIDDFWSFSSVTTYVDSEYGYNWDGDTGPEPISTLVDARDDETFSQEFRFTYESERLQGVIGAYYSDLESTDVYSGKRFFALQQFGLRQMLEQPPFSLPAPVADMVWSLYTPFDPAQLDSSGDIYRKISSAAVYADFTYEINEQWAVFGGLRYDREEQENSADTDIVITNADLMPDPANPAIPAELSPLIAGINAQIMALANNASGTEPLTDEDFDAWLPKIGVSYTWSDDLSAHLTYQKGYRSGGVGTNTATTEVYTFEPEYTDNYELALRSVWLEGDLVANFNLFYLDWTDQQVRVQLSSNTYDAKTENAGSSTVKGFELETLYYLNDEIRINAGIGQSKTEFKEFLAFVNGKTRDLSGRTFGAAPEWTANVGLTYENADGWFANISANYADSHDATNNPYVSGLEEGDVGFDPQNDARTLVNARVGYTWENMGVFVNGTNLFDEQYIVANSTEAAGQGVRSYELGEVRQFSISFSMDF